MHARIALHELKVKSKPHILFPTLFSIAQCTFNIFIAIAKFTRCGTVAAWGSKNKFILFANFLLHVALLLYPLSCKEAARPLLREGPSNFAICKMVSVFNSECFTTRCIFLTVVYLPCIRLHVKAPSFGKRRREAMFCLSCLTYE